jgi:hypothetical protein
MKGMRTVTAFLLAAGVAVSHAAARDFKKKAPAPQEQHDNCRRIEKGAGGVTLFCEMKNSPFPFKGSPYTDATTIVFVPLYFRATTGSVDMVVHFHGHRTTAEQAMKEHQLREQLVDSGQNAILAIPQGPVRAPDSSGGKLEQPGGLSRLLNEVVRTLQSSKARSVLGASAVGRRARVGKVVISAHSGGWKVAARCLDHGGVEIAEVYLFDALYGDLDSFLRWLLAGRRHKLVSYYTGGKTEAMNLDLMKKLKSAKIKFLHATTEGAITKAQMISSRAIFIRTELSHGRTPYKHNNLRDCLLASSLKRDKKLRPTHWFDDKNSPRKIEPRKD